MSKNPKALVQGFPHSFNGRLMRAFRGTPKDYAEQLTRALTFAAPGDGPAPYRCAKRPR